MAVQICPECGAICQENDTHCMDCGCDIAEAERAIARRAIEERGGGPIVGDQHTVEGAAAGMAEPGETSEKVRLRQFDRHLAEKLVRERTAVIVTAIIALIFGATVTMLGLRTLRDSHDDGALAALKQMSYGDLRTRGLGAFADETFVAALMILLGLAGLMCAAGQIHRVMLAHQAVTQVRQGERPVVVGISQLTWIGLLIASFICFPLGIILGIILMLSKDAPTHALGLQMLKSAILAVVVIGGHLIWNAIADFASREAPAPSTSTNSG
ncbi:MAG TPA: hypothetical protein DEP45_09105 [Armatimonadetes bacterium]|nr:hypothetical protein [Armatimonadota bacterium]